MTEYRIVNRWLSFDEFIKACDERRINVAQPGDGDENWEDE